MRTRYVAEKEEAHTLGASDVICEELESGVEAVARVMKQLAIPRNVIEERVERIRDKTQPSSRKTQVGRTRLAQVPDLGDLKIDSLLVRETDHACGLPAAEMQIRNKTGALVVAIRRDDNVIPYASASEPFRAGDVVFLVGPRTSMSWALELFALGTATGAEARATRQFSVIAR